MSEKTLSEQGLAWHQAAPGTDALVCSTPERAMLELCDGVAGATLVYEADALMQAMTTLRPQRVSLLFARTEEEVQLEDSVSLRFALAHFGDDEDALADLPSAPTARRRNRRRR